MVDDDGLIDKALQRCEPIECSSLENFLGPLLDKEPTVLATMPGSPGQVMAAQFVCYVKHNVSLVEPLRRQTEHSARLTQSVLRLPTAKKKKSSAVVSSDKQPTR